jgi:predicted transcriptional regulator
VARANWVRLAVDVTPELKARLQALADDGDRPLSREARTALAEYVERRRVERDGDCGE